MTEIDPLPPPAAAPPSPVAPASAVASPPRPKSRFPMFLFGAFSGCVLAIFAVVFFAVMVTAARQGESAGDVFSTQKVAVVPIEGEILGARETIEALHRYANNDTVKAVVIRINSPGGAIAPAQEIYEAIRSTRAKSGKPVVASLDSVAASGGFYIAAACDRIVANPGSITGSIGVILEWMDIKDLIAWAKIKPAVNFHALRHTYASLSVMAGMPLVVLSRNLGHSTTRMCERHYAHLATDYVADQVRAAAPVFGLKPSNVRRIG